MRFTFVFCEFARLAIFATCMSAASAATVSGRLELPAGVWVFFAVPPDAPPEGQPRLRGAHAVYSQCARDRYLREAVADPLSLEKKPAQRLDNFYDLELRFAGYPAPPARFNPKPPDFSRAPTVPRETRVELEAAAAGGADYSQEVAVARWRCGADCENWALVDLASGHIHLPVPPWTTLHTTFPCDVEPIEYRLDSRLLRLHRLDADNIRTQTYLWSNEDHALTPLVEGVAPVADFCAASAQRSGE